LGQELTNLRPEQAVERALSGHPLLASGHARIQGAQGTREQSGLRPNPRLFLQSENTRFGGASPFRFSQETDNFAYVSQALEAPGKRDSRVALSTEVGRRREAEVEVLRARIAQNVAGAYWSVVGAERIRDILRQSLATFDQTVQYHRDRVREGALAEVDLIRVEVEREQVSVQLQNAEQDVRRLRIQLFREMGEPADQSGVVLTGDLSDIRPFVTHSPDEAIAHRRDLHLGRQIVQQAKAAAHVEQVNAKPDPEVLFGYKRTAGFNTVIAGVQLPLPFRNRNQGAIAASLAEAKAAEYDVRSAEISARSEIAAAQADYEQKLRLITDTLPRIREQAEDTVRIARAVHREGASDLLRLLDAERTGLQAQLLFVRTLMEYRLALVNLQAATGMLP
jgi:outer membrane protein, heavy metal efflux system